MTWKEDNVGFLATESGLRQFQLSLWEGFILKGAPHNTGENPRYGMIRGGGALWNNVWAKMAHVRSVPHTSNV
jgi:hypothetical protein